MFFILSKTISYLFLPGTVIGLCWVFFFILRKRKPWANYLAIAGFVCFIVFTNDFTANSLLKAWEREPVPYDTVQQQHFTYGVLLTGMNNSQKAPDDRVHFGYNADRMLQMLTLFEQGVFDTLYISGGGATALRSDLQEALQLRSYLEGVGFPMEKVLTESKSRNTYESALMSRDHLTSDNRILLITSASHMPRAEACFVKQGFTVFGFPTVYYTVDGGVTPEMFIPGAGAFFKWSVLMKELMGYSAYWAAGYL